MDFWLIKIFIIQTDESFCGSLSMYVVVEVPDCLSFWHITGQFEFISHTGTIVPECYKDDVESQRKNLKFDPPPVIRKRLNRWSAKFARVITSRIPTAMQNFITIRFGNSPSPTYIRSCLYRVLTRLLFWGSNNPLPPRPLRRFWRFS